MNKVLSMIEEMVEWFYRQPTQEIQAYDVIARKMRDLRIAHATANLRKAVTQEDVNRMVTMCRMHLELKRNTTLINIKNYGYKLANKDELAIATAKWVKRTVMYADRTYRLVDIVDRKKIPGALAKVFGDAEGKIKTLGNKSRAFASAFVTYANQRKLEHKENNNGTKTEQKRIKRKDKRRNALVTR